MARVGQPGGRGSPSLRDGRGRSPTGSEAARVVRAVGSEALHRSVGFTAPDPDRAPVTLDEFGYRFDRPWQEREIFAFVLCRVALEGPLPYRKRAAERTTWISHPGMCLVPAGQGR